MTFEEIAACARELIPVFRADGGQTGERQDMRVIAELAHAMHRLEHNLARQFALDRMGQSPRMGVDGSDEMHRWELELERSTVRFVASLRAGS